MSLIAPEVNAQMAVINTQQASLSGRLDRLVAKRLLEEGRRLIESAGQQWQLDLSGVTQSSSVGIALLLDWLRFAQQKNTRIEFINVPHKMRQVIEFSGLNEVLKDALS